MIGVPYAKQISADEVECPACKQVIRLRRKKDEESYSTREYALHYQTEHMPDEPAGP